MAEKIVSLAEAISGGEAARHKRFADHTLDALRDRERIASQREGEEAEAVEQAKDALDRAKRELGRWSSYRGEVLAEIRYRNEQFEQQVAAFKAAQGRTP